MVRYFSVFSLFNPLNPPYQGDFKRKCVSPVLIYNDKYGNMYEGGDFMPICADEFHPKDR